jgi:DNA-binding transcriptional ArsR family regulator
VKAAKSADSEQKLLGAAFSWLRERLPEDWNLRGSDPTADGPGSEERWRIEAQNVFGTILVESRQSLTPRDAERLLVGFGRGLRSLSGAMALLVVAPWLSTRTRDLLTSEEINYIDLTGNARIQMASPAIYIESTGASRNPQSPERGKARVRGPKAARLIRALIDVKPPYTVGQLASATNLAPGYVSRLLEALYDEALIERAPRGPVEQVDVPGLIRRWASSYDVLASNDASSFVSRADTDATLDLLARREEAGRVAVTGSFAAIRIKQIAAPALLLAYAEHPGRLAQELNLLPASAGANVILLEPFDPVVWTGNEIDAGVRFVAPSQIAVDCLTGTGRMPAEGEAVLGWMNESEPSWRLPSISEWNLELP